MPALRSRAPFQWVKCIFFMPLQIARAFVCWASIQTGDCERCEGAAGCRLWGWVCHLKKIKIKKKCYDRTCLEMNKQLLVPGGTLTSTERTVLLGLAWCLWRAPSPCSIPSEVEAEQKGELAVRLEGRAPGAPHCSRLKQNSLSF